MSTFLLILMIGIDILALVMGFFCPPMLMLTSLTIMGTVLMILSLL